MDENQPYDWSDAFPNWNPPKRRKKANQKKKRISTDDELDDPMEPGPSTRQSPPRARKQPLQQRQLQSQRRLQQQPPQRRPQQKQPQRGLPQPKERHSHKKRNSRLKFMENKPVN